MTARFKKLYNLIRLYKEKVLNDLYKSNTELKKDILKYESTITSNITNKCINRSFLELNEKIGRARGLTEFLINLYDKKKLNIPKEYETLFKNKKPKYKITISKAVTKIHNDAYLIVSTTEINEILKSNIQLNEILGKNIELKYSRQKLFINGVHAPYITYAIFEK